MSVWQVTKKMYLTTAKLYLTEKKLDFYDPNSSCIINEVVTLHNLVYKQLHQYNTITLPRPFAQMSYYIERNTQHTNKKLDMIAR